MRGMRLIDGVHLVGGGDLGFGLSHRSDGHMYAIASGGEVALIDVGTGLDTDSVVRHLRDDSLDPAAISRLFVTHYHPDHAGGLASWRRHTGATTFAGRDGASAIEAGDEETCGLAAGRRARLYPQDWRLEPCPVDTRLDDGWSVDIGELRLLAISTPGHCRGHMSFLLTGAPVSVLFSGDAVFWGGAVVLQNVPDVSIPESAESLERLAQLEFDGLLPGHLAISLSNGRRHVEAAVEHFRNLRLPPPLVP
jgi:glyoxylase-like metal-dependent hydrolase (beta-lactamase superfamily II)